MRLTYSTRSGSLPTGGHHFQITQPTKYKSLYLLRDPFQLEMTKYARKSICIWKCLVLCNSSTPVGVSVFFENAAVVLDSTPSIKL